MPETAIQPAAVPALSLAGVGPSQSRLSLVAPAMYGDEPAVVQVSQLEVDLLGRPGSEARHRRGRVLSAELVLDVRALDLRLRGLPLRGRSLSLLGRRGVPGLTGGSGSATEPAASRPLGEGPREPVPDWLQVRLGTRDGRPELRVLARLTTESLLARGEPAREAAPTFCALRLPIAPARQAHVEVIRFAAANRLLVELDYRDVEGQRTTRIVEPYSLRQTQAGDIILHTHDIGKNAHRGLRLDRIEGARVTNRSFTPRHQIELTPTGPVAVAPSTARAPSTATRSTSGLFGTARPARAPVRRSPARLSASGPTYVIQCPICQKKFNRKSYDTRLNAHKNDWGGQCSGRTGYLVDTRY